MKRPAEPSRFAWKEAAELGKLYSTVQKQDIVTPRQARRIYRQLANAGTHLCDSDLIGVLDAFLRSIRRGISKKSKSVGCHWTKALFTFVRLIVNIHERSGTNLKRNPRIADDLFMCWHRWYVHIHEIDLPVQDVIGEAQQAIARVDTSRDVLREAAAIVNSDDEEWPSTGYGVHVDHLAALCRELARNGNGSFFLSARNAAELTGSSRMSAFRYLTLLVNLGWIRVRTAGTQGLGGMATTYEMEPTLFKARARRGDNSEFRRGTHSTHRDYPSGR